MGSLIPHTQPAVWPQGMTTTRYAAHFHSVPTGCRVGIIGLADDEGVRLNGGRVGAKGGPEALRAALAKYGTAQPEGFSWPAVFDAGDVVPGATLEETHDRVTQATAALLSHGLFPIAIGGGHDLTFPFVRGVIDHAKSKDEKAAPLAGVYLDAHLDVRAEPGSGMAFRSLVEHCGVRELHIAGFCSFVNGHEHVEWFKKHGGKFHHHKVQPGHAPGPMHMPALGNCFVSLDMDVIDMAHAPGVSAMNPSGWSVHQAELWAYGAGRSERVRCFDIMELNPACDEGGRTARVAAHLLLMFLRGFVERHG